MYSLYRKGYVTIVRLFYDFISFFQCNTVFFTSYIQSNGNRVQHNNWGDDINKFFIESISDLKVESYNISYIHKLFSIKKYSCIGSILGTYNESKLIVWGSGCISEESVLKQQPYKICSVRGPLTRNVLLKQGIDCPKIYGDPALLISRYYRPDVEQKYDVGIIPHYMDEDSQIFDKLMESYPNILIIKMKGYKDWHDIPDKICSCKHIISSSLHGLIVSDSYGIPNVWVRFSTELKGGEFKFRDYFGSVGRLSVQRYQIDTKEDLINLIHRNVYGTASFIDFKAIKDACPFSSHLYNFKYN